MPEIVCVFTIISRSIQPSVNSRTMFLPVTIDFPLIATIRKVQLWDGFVLAAKNKKTDGKTDNSLYGLVRHNWFIQNHSLLSGKRVNLKNLNGIDIFRYWIATFLQIINKVHFLQERWQSGRMCPTRNRVCRKVPGVRIPPSPPINYFE